MNLVAVYEELKYTGQGIRIAIIDDGLEHIHEDIWKNYVSDYFVIYLIFIRRLVTVTSVQTNV